MAQRSNISNIAAQPNVSFAQPTGYGQQLPPGYVPSNQPAVVAYPSNQSAYPGGTRQRARSNINMVAPNDTQGQGYPGDARFAEPPVAAASGRSAGGIAQWQSGVAAASQQGDEREYAGYGRGNPSAPTSRSSGPGSAKMRAIDMPEDPGPPPNFEGLGMSKSDKKTVKEMWQRKKDTFDAYQASIASANQPQHGHGRSKSQSRYADQAFPSGGYSSASDLEGRMNRLSMRAQPQNPSTLSAQQRQTERGRRLSGGALGLSGSAAKEAEAQAMAERMLRERSRSRAPETQAYGRSNASNIANMGGGDGRPAYMPGGGGGGGDRMLADPNQPGIVPRGYGQQVQQHQVQQMPGGTVGGGARMSNIGQAQPGHSPMIGAYGMLPSPQPGAYGMQPSPQPGAYGIQPSPQPSPIYGQAGLPQVSSADGMVPVTINGYTTMAYPAGQVQDHPGLYNAMQQQQLPGIVIPSPMMGVSAMPPGISPIGISPIGGPGISPMAGPGQGMYVTTPSFIGQSIPGLVEATPNPKRVRNIAEVSGQNPHDSRGGYGHGPSHSISGYPSHDKTFITPGPAPKQLTRTNITAYTSPPQQSTQPGVVPAASGRSRALSTNAGGQSGYVVPPVAGQHFGQPQPPPLQTQFGEPGDYGYSPIEPPSASGTSAMASTISGGRPTEGSGRPISLHAGRPALTHQETASSVGLSQQTGPTGFGNRPSHTRKPSYQTALKQPSQTNTPDSTDFGRGERIPVSMRKPNPRMQVRPFPATVISYDLNSEHRADEPLRFGRFVYDRDVAHDEWSTFTKQILDAWKARDPRYTKYHSAVRKINTILSAWNYAFFNPRGMDVVLFKGNERRSGNRFGHPETEIDFLEEAGPVSDDGESIEGSSSEDEEDERAQYLMGQDPAYRARMEREKLAMKAYRKAERQKEAQERPLEAAHALVIYDLFRPGEQTR